jgi:DNA-binding transcriptional LysR family regulator
MNIHHLELFYYVARHRGISEAVRKMPYGIQQPAISAQMLRLEDDLGTTLFQRKPFKLLPPGEKLYAFIEPFFANVERVSDEIRGETVPVLRIGASELVLNEYLPAVLNRLREDFPKLRCS